MKKISSKSNIGNVKNKYDASRTSKHRKATPVKISSEDNHLTREERRRLLSNTQDQFRNIPQIGWMIRRYTKTISRFKFQANTGIPELDIALEDLIKWHGKKKNFDVGSRHSRNEMMRIFNLSKLTAGDAMFVKTSKNAKLQGIPTDRLRVPQDWAGFINEKLSDWNQKTGLKIDGFGAVAKYFVSNRTINGDGYDNSGQLYNADDVIFDGYFTDFDQTRGVSPLAAAINKMYDLNKGHDWLLKKIELQAMLSLIITQGADKVAGGGFEQQKIEPEYQTDDDGEFMLDESGQPIEVEDELADDVGEKYEAKVQDGLMKLELNEGENAHMLQDTSPNAEIMPWSEMMMRIIFWTLDIPYSSWDSAKANYSAKRGDMADFFDSVKDRREQNQEVLNEYTEFLLDFANPKGRLKAKLDKIKELCKANDLDINDLKWEWIPSFNSWLDKFKEMQGYEKQIAVGMISTPQACKEMGSDAYDIMEQEAKYMNKRRELGLPIMIGVPGQVVEETKKDDEDKIKKDKNKN